jgi:succinate dehydrogenase / fumarate reductase iron-sulfur subunit
MAASPDTAAARPTAAADRAGRPKGHVVKEGHLPVSEFLYDKPGAGSPYGDEVEFPLPADKLPYRHPQQAPPRDH